MLLERRLALAQDLVDAYSHVMSEAAARGEAYIPLSARPATKPELESALKLLLTVPHESHTADAYGVAFLFLMNCIPDDEANALNSFTKNPDRPFPPASQRQDVKDEISRRMQDWKAWIERNSWPRNLVGE